MRFVGWTTGALVAIAGLLLAGCAASSPPLAECESETGSSPAVCDVGTPVCDDETSIDVWCFGGTRCRDGSCTDSLQCTDGMLPDCPDGGSVRCLTARICDGRDPCDLETVEVETATGDATVDDDGCD